MYEMCVYLLIKAHSVCTNMHGLKAPDAASVSFWFFIIFSRLVLPLALQLQSYPMALWSCVHLVKTIRGHGSVLPPTAWLLSVLQQQF